MRLTAVFLRFMLALAVVSWFAAQSVAADRSAAPAARDNPDVVMYATQSCGYCAKARAFFKERKVAWREIDIEKSDKAKREWIDRGGQGTPLIFVDGERVSGFNAVALQALLDKHAVAK